MWTVNKASQTKLRRKEEAQKPERNRRETLELAAKGERRGDRGEEGGGRGELVRVGRGRGREGDKGVVGSSGMDNI